ncbi:hypothetical protein BH23CHL5_BH23CHL5_03020 [soil metagenome]
MIQLVIRAVVAVVANAIGLLAASALLDKFEVNGASFVIAVIIFSAATVILGPLVIKIALTSATYLMGGIALVTTLLGLIITNLLSDGFTITGITTWIFATLIVWIFSVISSLLVPWILVKAAITDSPGRPSSPGQNLPGR